MFLFSTQAQQQLDRFIEELHDLENQLKVRGGLSKEIKNNFKNIAAQRKAAFLNCLEYLKKQVDTIFKKLTECHADYQLADITTFDVDEPFLHGLLFMCQFNGKPALPIQNLSGGERSLASLTLLHALCEYGKPPLQLFDEVDAAMDSRNCQRWATYMANRLVEGQTLVVTHNTSVAQHADELAGLTFLVSFVTYI